ncbi:hypothetical protein JCM5353_006752 [Sporobolomyces roseus]
MATTMLNHLLSHHLQTNEQLSSSLVHIQHCLTSQRLIQQVEQDTGIQSPILHRWQLRILSLLNPTNSSSVRSAGFDLLLTSFTQSNQLFLQASKQSLTPALQILSNPQLNKLDQGLWFNSLHLTQFIMAKSTWYPEWARENIGAQVVQKLITSLVQAISISTTLQIQLASLSTICTLLPLFPTALRPLSPSLHNLSISLLCSPNSSPSLKDSASSLFVNLYLLAPKGKEGLREAWKTGVEALIASCDELTNFVSGGIFAEDMMTNHSLSPLSLPPLPSSRQSEDSSSPFPALDRLETLMKVLVRVLKTPTSEKAGQVNVPVGALVELGSRLAGFNVQTPIRERVDPSTQTLIYSLLPKLQVMGCQLLAQVALSVGTKLVSFSSLILGTISRTLSTYPVRSPMRPVLSISYSLIFTSLSSSLDPSEASKSLARVWRTLLEDISAVALEPLNVAATEKTQLNGNGGGGGKKVVEGRKNGTKRMKESFDPSESMVRLRSAVDELDLDIAIKALSTLERLLSCPSSSFLPNSLQLSTSRLLLYISLSPSFFTLSPLLQTPTFFPSTSAQTPLEITKQSLPFKLSVLRALKTSNSVSIGGNGLLERSLPVWNACVLSTSTEIRSIGLEGLAQLGRVVHPKLVPASEGESLRRARAERKGGEIGDDEDVREGLEEFRRKEEEKVYREEEEVSNDGEDEEMGERQEGERKKRKLVQQEEEEIKKKDQFKTQPASTVGGGFSSFQAPTFGATITTATTTSSKSSSSSFPPSIAPLSIQPSKPEIPTPAPVLSFSTETITSNTKPKDKVVVEKKVSVRGEGGDSEDDSDDEMMPSIDLGSDGE